MAGKKRTSSGATIPAKFDDELVASEEVLIAKWNELSDERLKEQIGKYRTAIEDLEKSGADKGPTTFEYEEEVEVEGCEGDEEGGEGGAARADGEAAAGEDEADDILGQLVEMFVAENGRDPTDEEISQWVQTLKEAAEEGLQM